MFVQPERTGGRLGEKATVPSKEELAFSEERVSRPPGPHQSPPCLRPSSGENSASRGPRPSTWPPGPAADCPAQGDARPAARRNFAAVR